MKRIATATAVAAGLSGLPSTVHAMVTRTDPLAAARAAGTLVPGGRAGLARGVLAHIAISSFWGTILGVSLPHRHTMAWGAAAGFAIAAIDLGVVGRRYPAIHALPPVPQLADHVAFGAMVGAVLARRLVR